MTPYEIGLLFGIYVGYLIQLAIIVGIITGIVFLVRRYKRKKIRR